MSVSKWAYTEECEGKYCCGDCDLCGEKPEDESGGRRSGVQGVYRYEEGTWHQILAPIRHGHWVKMSDADGVYWCCSECGVELPRVVYSFDREFDLFPRCKSIEKTSYCPHCGARMDGEE